MGGKSKILKMDLVKYLHPLSGHEKERQEPRSCSIDDVSAELISHADLITFPMGSFFSSVLVNLLPQGVGKAITERDCPKVYIPNTGEDPEVSAMVLSSSSSALTPIVILARCIFVLGV